MAEGDVLLDEDGNVKLDEDGNVMLSDGSGDDCPCGCGDTCEGPCCDSIEVTITGFAGDCSVLNGTHTLTGCVTLASNTDEGCAVEVTGGYSKVVGTGSNPGDYRIELSTEESDGVVWTLDIRDTFGGCASGSSFSCDDPRNNAFVSEADFCATCPHDFDCVWEWDADPGITATITPLCEEGI